MTVRVCSLFGAAILPGLTGLASAEVLASAPDRYELRHEAQSSLAPDALWERLTRPEDWWHPDHTYSGDARNLSLDIQAGGLWREDWDGGSVAHGAVLLVKEGEQLRLDAPFGPLQALGVSVVWTVTLTPIDGGGTRVVFEERASGTDESALDTLAPAVDFVKQQAISRLVDPETGPGDR